MEPIKPYKSTRTIRFLDQLNTILYLAGYRNFWVQEVNFSKKFTTFYDYFSIILHILTIGFSFMQFGSMFTQPNLTPKQQVQRNVAVIGNTLTHMYSIKYFICREETRTVLYYLTVLLKEDHNDPDVERSMIKTLKVYLIAFTVCSSIALVYYGLYAIIQVITTGEYNI